MVGVEPWISCISSCKLYHYATSVHFTVITWYIATENYTGVALYLLDVPRGSRSAPGSCHDVTGPGPDSDIDLNFLDAHVGSAIAQVGCEILPASGVQAGTDCCPSSGCSALSDSKSARLGSGAARPLFTSILDHDLFGCCCELKLIVEPPASTEGRQVGLERKLPSGWASWAEAKLGPKHKSDFFQGSSLNS
jgi:hypothetical protein